jgi:L-threonylcarbamoyladenylate synthase
VLREAAAIIQAGGLVIIPTETVYGIAANMQNKKAMERLSRLKERPKDKPFSLHIYKRETVDEMQALTSVAACKLMSAFWPGPLTLIFKRLKEPSLGIRMPDDESLRSSRGQVSVVCPSANISSQPAPVTFADA